MKKLPFAFPVLFLTMSLAATLTIGCGSSVQVTPDPTDSTPPEVTLSITSTAPRHFEQLTGDSADPSSRMLFRKVSQIGFLAQGLDEDGGIEEVKLILRIELLCIDANASNPPQPGEFTNHPVMSETFVSAGSQLKRAKNVSHRIDAAALTDAHRCDDGPATFLGEVFAQARNSHANDGQGSKATPKFKFEWKT